jgi:hypothetical protein
MIRTQDAYRTGTPQFSSIFTSDDDSFISEGEDKTAAVLPGMHSHSHESEEENDAQHQQMRACGQVAEQGTPKHQDSRWPSRHMTESIARTDQLLRAKLSDLDLSSSMRFKIEDAVEGADVCSSSAGAGTPKRHNSLMSWLSPMKRRNHVLCSRGEGFEAALALALDKVKEAKSARLEQISAMEVLKDKVSHGHASIKICINRLERHCHAWNM